MINKCNQPSLQDSGRICPRKILENYSNDCSEFRFLWDTEHLKPEITGRRDRKKGDTDLGVD